MSAGCAAAPAGGLIGCRTFAVPGTTVVGLGYTSAQVYLSIWDNGCAGTVYASANSFPDPGGFVFLGSVAIGGGNHAPVHKSCTHAGICDSDRIAATINQTVTACYFTDNGQFRLHPNSSDPRRLCTSVKIT